MLNELFSTVPASRGHATYLENRRANLLRRLDTVSTTSPQSTSSTGDNSSLATFASQDYNLPSSSDISSTLSSSFTTASFPPLTPLSDTPASSIEFTD
ncbi:hypothetical protein GN244_ATG18588 [Phytophthora infestans]|uniref:Uncharacterized protein n=1 Tax=Phytophthora infestans TaxID=4787 RepID=A0A833W4N7_PHYIN|nr:hypothetical protein GN244_ATG18588 [Phytophthora infestans]KAF4143643.1 hypothetical protein GN958_ATG07163 [Phytophthora infestans]